MNGAKMPGLPGAGDPNAQGPQGAQQRPGAAATGAEHADAAAGAGVAAGADAVDEIAITHCCAYTGRNPIEIEMADEDTVPNAPAPDSSPSAAPAAEPAPSPAPSTETSTDQGTSKESLLDAVLKVVPATTETPVLSSEDKPATPEATEPDSPDQAEEEPDTGAEEDDKLPEGVTALTRKKFNKLLKQRKEDQAELARLAPVAEIGSELEQFAKTNDLSGEDIAGTLRIAAMLRQGDYASFYKAIAPFVRTAQEYLGVVLPKDLAESVRQGQMTEAMAKEFARQRFDGQRSQFELKATEQAHQRSQVQAVQSDVQRAVSSFELRLSASDPDYKAKAPSVRRAAQALLFERGGTISSVQEALEITKSAYDEVNKQMRAFQPVPRATHPMPNGASQTPSARAAPKSMMEAAMLALENSRRGG